MSWPSGYGTMIGQRASAVSGGQRQRICLARALADEPQVIVLDEPTPALDVRSEDAVSRSLDEIKSDTVLVLVAHRLSTLSMCDRIVVMDGGRGVGRPAATPIWSTATTSSERSARSPDATRTRDGRPTRTLSDALVGYGIGPSDIECLEPLPRGIKNLNHRVRAGGEDWVLKRHPGSVDAARLAVTHAFEARLATAGLPGRADPPAERGRHGGHHPGRGLHDAQPGCTDGTSASTSGSRPTPNTRSWRVGWVRWSASCTGRGCPPTTPAPVQRCPWRPCLPVPGGRWRASSTVVRTASARSLRLRRRPRTSR